ncbi:putative U3 small nucleolar RNA-associated protein 6 -like protein [Capsicum annuum]|nr:putative U3 small nucleolar RNA-associated protein 6 -like protein [Capsicum annuum]
MIDRLHHYIRELSIRRKTMEAVKKQNRAFEDGKSGASEEIKTLEGEASALRGKIRQLESELVEKAKEASNAEANAGALRKQSEGFLLEYDRLLEENQNLRSQLQSLDRKLSRSESKKVS